MTKASDRRKENRRRPPFILRVGPGGKGLEIVKPDGTPLDAKELVTGQMIRVDMTAPKPITAREYDARQLCEARAESRDRGWLD